MNTTTYAPNPVYMHPAVFALPPRPAVAAPRGVAPVDVSDLLDAAGSLSIADIAGGLDATLAAVEATVAWMVSRGDLRRDEWDRLRAVRAD